MTTLITRTVRAVTLGFLLSCSMATLAADGAPEIETRVPATLSGKLSYASMTYWVEVPGKGDVEIWDDDEAYAALIDLVGTQVSLEGDMVTYTNGSVYFQPKLAKAADGFTVRKNGDDSIEVRYGDEMLLRTDEYDAIKLTHRLPLVNGQVVLFELHSGGVACPVLYQLAVVHHGALPLLSPKFGTCSDLGKLRTSPDGFTLDLPGNPSERWAWDASSLTLRKQS